MTETKRPRAGRPPSPVKTIVFSTRITEKCKKYIDRLQRKNKGVSQGAIIELLISNAGAKTLEEMKTNKNNTE